MFMDSNGSYSRGADIVDDMSGLEATELRLGLPGTSSTSASSAAKKTKRPLDDEEPTAGHPSASPAAGKASCTDDQQGETSVTRPAKSQIVGWPPVQAFRRNARHNHQDSKPSPSDKEPSTAPLTTLSPGSSAALLVKVSMDGAPYLRKIDLGAYKGYVDLRLALDAMFNTGCSGNAAANHHNMITYEDKDGDWMLAGDVPWAMFAASCKRLRIVKGSGENRA